MIGKVSEITGAAHEPRYETMFLQGEWDRVIEEIDREIEDREMEENGTMGQRKYWERRQK